jgi:predicted permease
MPSDPRPDHPLWKPRLEDEVDGEIAFHVEMRTRELIAHGLDPARARAEALRRFGDIGHVSEACLAIGRNRDRARLCRRIAIEVRQDIVYAVRQMARNPGFAAVAILTLALGIGATTAIFSAVESVVLRPLPLPDPGRVVFVAETWRGRCCSDVSAGNYVDTLVRTTAFAALAAVDYVNFNLADTEGEPERVVAATATASFFQVMGLEPALGRVFTADEDQPGRDGVVVLSHRLWARRFGADRAIVGRAIRLNGRPYDVLGVMPEALDRAGSPEELWAPIAFPLDRRRNHDDHDLTVYGRLAPGASLPRAQTELDAVAAYLRREFAHDDAERGLTVSVLRDTLVGDYRRRLFVLLGAVGFVLLIACANVANLLFARGAGRTRELALRLAVGASRARVTRQLVTEGATLALVAGGAGLLLATWGIHALLAAGPPDVPRLEETRIDAPVLAFALAVAMASSLAASLVPAWRASRVDVVSGLKEGGREVGGRPDRLRTAFVGAEVALALILLVGAGLLVRSAIALQRVQLGFEPAGLLSARLTLPESSYQDAPRVVLTLERLVEASAHVPGGESAAVVSQAPLGPGGNSNGLIPEGRPLDITRAIDSRLRIITPDYFRVMRVPVLQGRAFTDADGAGAPRVMIVSETLAREAWPGLDPIGRRIACCEPAPEGGPSWKTVVGVAGDVRSRGPGETPRPEFYLPAAQAPAASWRWIQRTLYLVVRTAGEPESLVTPVRRVAAGVAPDAPLFDIRTMDDRLAGSLAVARFNTLLLSLLGALGLALAAVGIYGVVAYSVSQRTQEIGVRLALGATRGDVVAMMIRHAARPVAFGIAIGLAASAAVTRALTSQLFGVSRSDPVTFAVVVGALTAVALVASAVPARRAASVDPTRALQTS